MPGVFASINPSNGQVDGAPVASASTSQDRIPYNVALILVASAVTLIALDKLNFRFAVGV